MAITTTTTVTGLTILNNADKIVSDVEITVTSTDDSDPSVLTISGTENVGVATTGGTSAAGFTTYANLTQSQILGWTPVADALASSNLTKNQTAWINSVKSPPTPPTKQETLPF